VNLKSATAGKDPVTNLTDHLANPWTANFTTNSASLNLAYCFTHSTWVSTVERTSIPGCHSVRASSLSETCLCTAAGLSLPFQNAVQAPFENHIGAFP
jgi:hypothetical protein